MISCPHDMTSRARSQQVRIASGINVLLGVFLIGSPWLFGNVQARLDMNPTLSVVVAGALVVICSVLRVSWPERRVGLSGANIAFGIWTLTSPWVFGYSVDTLHTSLSFIIGVAIILSGTWSSSATLREQHERLV